MVRLRTVLFIVFLLFTLYESFQTIKSNPYHSDEISWFYHTEFYQLIRKGDFSSPKWQSYESYDHPQLSKYFFGLALSLYDSHVFEKRFELEKKFGRWNFYYHPDIDRILANYFSNYIIRMRYVNMFFTFLSIFFIWKITSLTSKNECTSMITPFILLNNEFFLRVMLRATSDAHTICFILFSWYILMRFSDSKRTSYLIYFIIASGLAVSSKLTGLISCIAYSLHTIISLLFGQEKNINKKISQFLYSILGIFFIWTLFNPALYLHPIQNSYSYIDFRLKQSILLQDAYPQISLPTFSKKINAVVCTLIITSCEDIFEKGYVTKNSWLNLLLILLGLYFIFIKSKNTSFKIINGSFIYAHLLLTGGYIPLNMDRYFTPLVVIIMFIQSLGIIYILTNMTDIVRKKINPALRRG